MAALGWAGCVSGTTDSTEVDEEEDAVAATQSALQTPTCVTVKRGVLGDVKDTFLSGDYPFWAPGSESSLWTGKSGGGSENISLIKFDLSFLPHYVKVTSAVMMVKVSWNDKNNAVSAYRVLSPWAEATAKYDSFSAPSNFAATASGSFLAGDVGAKMVDITALARGWVNGSIANYGVALREPLVNNHIFWSSESSTLDSRPALGICYINGPKPHSGGALVAGGVISDSPNHQFIGTLGESPGGNRVSVSPNHRFIGGIVGGTQE